jgi:succinate dehydrogenase / fumarate reductase cytochrome b subunit
MAALWHGLIGLRYSIADYLRGAGWRVVGYSTLWIVGLVFTALGSITIFTFDEAAAAANDGPLSDAFWIADVLGYSLFVFAIGIYLGVVALAVWVGRSLAQGGPPVYNGDIGQYAWALHRLTGIGVLFFLLVHIIDIMLIGLGQEIYDESVEFYANPFLVPMEVALVGAVVYHTLNGLRIAAIDFTEGGTRRQRQMFWAVLAGAVVLTIPSAIVILLEEF